MWQELSFRVNWRGWLWAFGIVMAVSAAQTVEAVL